MCDVLVAAGWICGEYGAFDDEEAMNLIAFLLSPSVLTTSPQVQACYLSAFLKVFIRSNLSNEYTTQVEKFAQSAHLEIQERVSFVDLGKLYH
jgi:hypothetical protein